MPSDAQPARCPYAQLPSCSGLRYPAVPSARALELLLLLKWRWPFGSGRNSIFLLRQVLAWRSWRRLASPRAKGLQHWVARGDPILVHRSGQVQGASGLAAWRPGGRAGGQQSTSPPRRSRPDARHDEISNLTPWLSPAPVPPASPPVPPCRFLPCYSMGERHPGCGLYFHAQSLSLKSTDALPRCRPGASLPGASWRQQTAELADSWCS